MVLLVCHWRSIVACSFHPKTTMVATIAPPPLRLTKGTSAVTAADAFLSSKEALPQRLEQLCETLEVRILKGVVLRSRCSEFNWHILLVAHGCILS